MGAVGLAWTVPAWNPELISGGAYKYAPFVQVPDLQTGLEEGDVLFYAEGAAGTVSVRSSGGTVALAIDGKVDASNGADMLTQSLLAHLPLLLHPSPVEVGIIGLGSGVTLGAALRHPIERADILEISPEVVEASAFFEAENHAALDDPRTRLILGDGRSHLLLSSLRYDVIVSEPSNPWMAGVSTLFTREFFQAARDSLRPGGILCQWAHTYDMSDADLRSIIATFLAVFPDGAMWRVGQGDLLLIGSLDPLGPRLQAVADHWERPGVGADLAAIGVQDAFGLLSLHLGGGDALRAYSAGARIQTDTRNTLEFSAPRSVIGGDRVGRPDLDELRSLAAREPAPQPIGAALASATPQQWLDRGRMQLQAAAYDAAYEDLSTAADMDPANPAILQALVRAAGGSGREQEALSLLDRLSSAIPAEPPLHIARSRLFRLSGRHRFRGVRGRARGGHGARKHAAARAVGVAADRRRRSCASSARRRLHGARRSLACRHPLLLGRSRVPAPRLRSGRAPGRTGRRRQSDRRPRPESPWRRPCQPRTIRRGSTRIPRRRTRRPPATPGPRSISDFSTFVQTGRMPPSNTSPPR